MRETLSSFRDKPAAQPPEGSGKRAPQEVAASQALSGLVTAAARTHVTLQRRWIVRLPDAWQGQAEILLGCPVHVIGQPTGRPRELAAHRLTISEEWSAPTPEEAACGRLAPVLAWLRAAGWPGCARRLARASPRERHQLLQSPYRLLEPAWQRRMSGRGLTFPVVDYLAQQRLGHAPDAPDRILAGIGVIVREAYRTHQASVATEELIKQLLARLRLDRIPPWPSAVPAHVAMQIEGRWYAPELARWRAEALARLAANQLELFSPASTEPPQAELARYRYAVLTGPAGSGKTSLIRRLAEQARQAGQRVLLCALTGKAAAVLSERAMTLHRALGYCRGRFLTRRLDADLVIVDEASMVTWPLVAATLAAAPGKVLWCGDARQLPPIGGESVFAALLERLPALTLQTVHRFLGINSQALTAPVVSILHASVERLLGTLYRLIQTHRTDGAVQVLTPVRHSTLGTAHLNALLQRRLNPDGRSLGRFRVGDRVIITKNCYQTATPVYNGQTGIVVDGGEGQLRIRLSSGLVVDVPDSLVELAYALTVHKAQGSQYDVVIVIRPRWLNGFIDERMVYVSQTRARYKTYELQV
jgi:exodeoxyribonuclease V alpha subunit